MWMCGCGSPDRVWIPIARGRGEQEAVVPDAGVEPATYRLQGGCSTS
jgi:hypothetical protein